MTGTIAGEFRKLSKLVSPHNVIRSRVIPISSYVSRNAQSICDSSFSSRNPPKNTIDYSFRCKLLIAIKLLFLFTWK